MDGISTTLGKLNLEEGAISEEDKQNVEDHKEVDKAVDFVTSITSIIRKQYTNTDEFLAEMTKFTGIDNTELKVVQGPGSETKLKDREVDAILRDSEIVSMIVSCLQKIMDYVKDKIINFDPNRKNSKYLIKITACVADVSTVLEMMNIPTNYTNELNESIETFVGCLMEARLNIKVKTFPLMYQLPPLTEALISKFIENKRAQSALLQIITRRFESLSKHIAFEKNVIARLSDVGTECLMYDVSLLKNILERRFFVSGSRTKFEIHKLLIDLKPYVGRNLKKILWECLTYITIPEGSDKN